MQSKRSAHTMHFGVVTCEKWNINPRDGCWICVHVGLKSNGIRYKIMDEALCWHTNQSVTYRDLAWPCVTLRDLCLGEIGNVNPQGLHLLKNNDIHSYSFETYRDLAWPCVTLRDLLVQGTFWSFRLVSTSGLLVHHGQEGCSFRWAGGMLNSKTV